jgi:serine/threonine protein kinase
MVFNNALEVFQHLLAIDEDKMLENLSTLIDENHAFYPDILSYIQAHGKNKEQTSFSALINDQAKTLVDDQSIHQLINSQIGNYTLTKKLGQGGMGTVYLGERHDGQIEQKVAIKFVYPSIAMLAGDDFLQKEAQCLATLDHHYIVKIHTVETTIDGLSYIVMEFIDGVPIDQYCKDHDLSLEKTITLFQKVCAAVQEAHNKFTIHADLKPSNIFVNKLGEPKLMDFGISRTLVDTAVSGIKSDIPEEDYMAAASRNFASPEQMNGQNLSTASDIYSAGKILQLLLKHCVQRLAYKKNGMHKPRHSALFWILKGEFKILIFLL